MIYLDYAATTPVDPKVLDAMLPFLTKYYGNPSSNHACGKLAKKAVEQSREELSKLLGSYVPNELIFCASATEASNLAIKGVAECYDEPRHFITSAFEHKATMATMKCLQQWGHEVSYIYPDHKGNIQLEDIENEIRPNTVLISIMHVNNEIGSISPIEEIGQLCKKFGILFHTDATQSFGKLPINLENIDLLSFSGHKIYGPKGVGGLYVSEEVELTCQTSGGSQEGGLRAGTQNVPGIVGLAKAAEIAFATMDEHYQKMAALEDVFIEEIRNNIPLSFMQGDRMHKVPWIVNYCFYDVDGGRLRDELSRRDICVSRSSACTKSGDPSHVLESLGTRDDLAIGAIRYSFGRPTSKSDVVLAAKETACIVDGLRAGEL